MARGARRLQDVGRLGRLVALQAGDNGLVTLPASIARCCAV
jgi:hypothetical protein